MISSESAQVDNSQDFPVDAEQVPLAPIEGEANSGQPLNNDQRKSGPQNSVQSNNDSVNIGPAITTPLSMVQISNGPQYVASQPGGVQYVVVPPPVTAQQSVAQPQIIYITLPSVQQSTVAANKKTEIIDENLRQRSFPLWIEIALFVCTVLMMCGVGWYLVKCENMYGKGFRRSARYIKDNSYYWAVVAELVRSVIPRTARLGVPRSLSMAPAMGLMVPAMIVSLIVGIVAVKSFKVRKNSKIIYFMTFLMISLLHLCLYVIGHQVTKPEKNRNTSKSGFKNKVNAVWYSYMLLMGATVLVQTISFIKSKGFNKSAVFGKIGGWIVKLVGIGSFYAYAVCIIAVVYTVNPVPGINYLYSAFGWMAALWTIYTALSFMRKTRTINDDTINTDHNVQVVKVPLVQVEETHV